MPYRYSPPKPARIADLRQASETLTDDAEVVAPPADNVAEAPEAAQDVLEDSLEAPEPVKRKRGRPRKNPA